MIKEIIELLKLIPYEEGGEAIKFAKGRNKVPKRFKDVIRYVKDRR